MAMTQQRPRRKRGSLSSDEIIAAALSLLDREGEAALTFARLGEVLESAPTAVYRHFASRNDIIRALADELDARSLDGYQPTDDWRVDLEELAWRAWRTATAHPAAAAISMNVMTNGLNELRAVDACLRALRAAGLDGREAVVQYQVYANLVLGAAAAQGTRLATPTERRTHEGWIQVYANLDPETFPHAEALKTELRVIDYEVVFATMIAMYLDRLELVAAGLRPAVVEPTATVPTA